MSLTQVQQSNITGSDANAGKMQSNWGTGGKMTQELPVSFELFLTDDLPNGPYGEMAGMGGKLYVSPGMTYNEVAGALIAAWVKTRGSMANMQLGRGVKTTITEEWKVASIEYKGGNVAENAPAVAGNHTAKMGLIQNFSTGGCCVVS